ncbi:MAG: nuclear transport factor 2 family protein [Balneolaceae bacterium]|jgi:ketosteroid isomerase-like protein
MINIVRKGAYFSSILFVLASCQPKQGVKPSKEAVMKAVEHQNEIFMNSYRNGNFKTTSGLYTEDAKVMAPKMESVSGREGIAHLMQGMQESGITAIELGTDELYITGQGAIEVGHYAVKVGNGQVVDNGKSMVYWKKDGDTWRMFRDIWNSNRSPASSDKNQSE